MTHAATPVLTALGLCLCNSTKPSAPSSSIKISPKQVDKYLLSGQMKYSQRQEKQSAPTTAECQRSQKPTCSEQPTSSPSRRHPKPQSTLSILDAVVTNYAACAAEIATSKKLGSVQLSGCLSTSLPDGKKVPFVRGTKPGFLVLIQLTQLGCGGAASVLRLPICRRYAGVECFMKRWSFEHSILFPNESTSVDSVSIPKVEPPSPVLSPQLLDSQAAGNINALSPDKPILARFRALPSSRYDWFYPASDGDPSRNLPAGIANSRIRSPEAPLPKEDRDTTLPVSHTELNFSAQQTKKTWKAAGGPDLGVSRHDAIVAYVWSAINRARGLVSDERYVSLH